MSPHHQGHVLVGVGYACFFLTLRCFTIPYDAIFCLMFVQFLMIFKKIAKHRANAAYQRCFFKEQENAKLKNISYMRHGKSLFQTVGAHPIAQAMQMCFYIIKSIAQKGYFGPKYP